MLLVALALGVFGADQLSKVAAERLVGAGCVAWGGVVRLRATRARSSRAVAAVWPIVAAAAIAVQVTRGPYPAAALVLVLAASASNVFDRIVRRGVVDFIAIGRWPRFNLADAAIVGGVVAALAV